MPSLRDIKRRIRSVTSTQQITKAMEMVAAARLRRAQMYAEQARPYADKMRQILTNLSSAADVTVHPFFEERPEKRITVAVLVSDRGLCGSFNGNVLRKAWTFINEFQTGNADGVAETVAVGKRAYDWLKKRDWEIVGHHQDFGGRLDFTRAMQISDELTERFLSGQSDAVYIVYPKFVSIARNVPTIVKFLPVDRGAAEGDAGEATSREYIFEPDAASIFNDLMPRYARTVVSSAMAELFASEHAARMLAMQNATKNAGEMIDSLTLTFNKARQAAITKEILDIVGGAEALK